MNANGYEKGDRGVTTIFVAIFASSVFLMVGLVYEGGRYLEAKRAARHAAVAAARAGAQSLDEEAIRNEGAEFNTLGDDARTRACSYLNNMVDRSKNNISCSDAEFELTDGGITVRVTAEVDMHILDGTILSRTVTEEGHACAEAGITEAGLDDGPLCD